MKKLFLLSMIFSATAFGHGSIELIECHSKASDIVVRGTAKNKANVFNFSAWKNGSQVWKQKSLKAKLSDTINGQQITENIKLKSKAGDSIHLKIQEIPTRKIRSGNGNITLAKAGIKGDFGCYAVY